MDWASSTGRKPVVGAKCIPSGAVESDFPVVIAPTKLGPPTMNLRPWRFFRDYKPSQPSACFRNEAGDVVSQGDVDIVGVCIVLVVLLSWLSAYVQRLFAVLPPLWFFPSHVGASPNNSGILYLCICLLMSLSICLYGSMANSGFSLFDLHPKLPKSAFLISL